MPAHPLTRIQVKAVLKQTNKLTTSETKLYSLQQVADLQNHIKPILTVSKSHWQTQF